MSGSTRFTPRSSAAIPTPRRSPRSFPSSSAPLPGRLLHQARARSATPAACARSRARGRVPREMEALVSSRRGAQDGERAEGRLLRGTGNHRRHPCETPVEPAGAHRLRRPGADRAGPDGGPPEERLVRVLPRPSSCTAGACARRGSRAAATATLPRTVRPQPSRRHDRDVPRVPAEDLPAAGAGVLPAHRAAPAHLRAALPADGGRGAPGRAGCWGSCCLKPGWREDYFGSPDTYTVGCAGTMEDVVRLPDGRCTLRLAGCQKIEIGRHAHRALPDRGGAAARGAEPDESGQEVQSEKVRLLAAYTSLLTAEADARRPCSRSTPRSPFRCWSTWRACTSGSRSTRSSGFWSCTTSRNAAAGSSRGWRRRSRRRLRRQWMRGGGRDEPVN